MRSGSFVRYVSAGRLFDDIIPWEQGALDRGEKMAGDDEGRLGGGWRRSADDGLCFLSDAQGKLLHSHSVELSSERELTT